MVNCHFGFASDIHHRDGNEYWLSNGCSNVITMMKILMIILVTIIMIHDPHDHPHHGGNEYRLFKGCANCFAERDHDDQYHEPHHDPHDHPHHDPHQGHHDHPHHSGNGYRLFNGCASWFAERVNSYGKCFDHPSAFDPTSSSSS